LNYTYTKVEGLVSVTHRKSVGDKMHASTRRVGGEGGGGGGDVLFGKLLEENNNTTVDEERRKGVNGLPESISRGGHERTPGDGLLRGRNKVERNLRNA